MAYRRSSARALASVSRRYRYSRILAAMVFKIDATDPLTFVLAPFVLSVVGLFATYLPAHKATLVDPNVALHYD